MTNLENGLTVPLKCKLPPLASFLARRVSFLVRQFSFPARRVSFLVRRFLFLLRITEAFSMEYITHKELVRVLKISTKVMELAGETIKKALNGNR